MEENNNEYYISFSSLKSGFDKLMISNPYLLKLLGSCKIKLQHEDSYTEYDYDSVYKKFRLYDTLRMIAFFLVGLAFSAIVLLLVYYVNKDITDQEERYQNVLSFMCKAMPFVCYLFSSMIGSFYFILRTVSKEDIRNLPVVYIITFFLQGLITVISPKLKQELVLVLCPTVAFIAIILYLLIIYTPLSSKKLNSTIISNAKVIQEKIDSINTEIIQKSHSQVLNKIKMVEKAVIESNWGELHKLQSFTVLDSLRLELIQNSINGINLVEDWKYLDLSQKMIDDIISCDNDRIIILGDLSFLSTEEGLEKLMSAIIKGKTFYIYFTGDKDDKTGAIMNNHCQELVNIIRKKYYNKGNVLKDIKDHINLYPILSESFTGIGFIGLLTNGRNIEDIDFDKVYAYISSHLIEETDMDITRANPFVFTWSSSNKMIHFKKFMKGMKELSDTTQFKVIIDGQSKERTEILSFNSQTKKHKR